MKALHCFRLAPLALVALVLSPVSAFADGFRCETPNDSLVIKIYNNTSAEIGTRVPAKVIVSDSRRNFGNKTIATFDGADGLIESDGAKYLVNVDGRFSGSDRGGEDIAGTKLRYLKTMNVRIAYNFSRPLEDGTRVSGNVVFTKTNGEKTFRQLVCARYLKLK